MADFSQDILKEILKATKESNKKLGTLEKQGKEDDTPQSIIAKTLPSVIAERRYSYSLPKELGLFKVDDILHNILKSQHKESKEIGAALAKIMNGAEEGMAQQYTATKETTAEIKKHQLLLTYQGKEDADAERVYAAMDAEEVKKDAKKDAKDAKKDARTRIKDQEEERKKLVEILEKQNRGIAGLLGRAKYNKLTYEIQKAELALRLKEAIGSAERKEIKEERKALDRKNQNLLRKIADGMTGLWTAAKANIAKVGKGLWTLLKGAAVAGLLVAFVAFLDSDLWEKWKKIIIEDIGPMLKKVYDKILVPIGNWLKNIFGPFFKDLEGWLDEPTWENIRTVIKDNKLATAALAAALLLFTPLGTITAGIISAMARVTLAFGPTAIATAFASGLVIRALGVGLLIYGIGTRIMDGFNAYFEKADEWQVTPMSAAIGAFFGSDKSGVEGSFKAGGSWAMAGVGIGLMAGNPFLALGLGMLGAVMGGILGFIGGEKIAEGIDKSVEFAKNMWDLLFSETDITIYDLLSPIILIVKATRKLASILGREVGPDLEALMGWLGIDAGEKIPPALAAGTAVQPKTSSTEALAEAAATTAAQYRRDRLDMWKTLINVPNAAEHLTNFNKDLRNRGLAPITFDKQHNIWRAAGGSFSAGRPMIVGELGPEMIFPSAGGHVMNAQRTAQILASGINRGMPIGGGGPALINAPVTSVNNSQNNTTVASTSLKHPSPLLAAVNAAA